MDRRFVLAVPLLTVAAVGYLVLHVGVPEPIRAARVWGGPTDTLGRWTGWVEAGQAEVLETPLVGALLQVSAEALDGRSTGTLVRLDAEGSAELAFDFAAAAPGRVRVRVEDAGKVLLDAPLELASKTWRARATRRGGWFSTSSRGEWSARLAAGRGAFAVPFALPLWVRVERAGSAVADVELSFQSDGAELEPKTALTDARGFARVGFAPREHGVTLRVRATVEGKTVLEWTSSVPIVPGAMLAEREGQQLRVRSPVEHAALFVTLVSERGRLEGRRVPLQASGRGGAEGAWLLPSLPNEELSWAVVASDRASGSDAPVGWPLFETGLEPPRTFDARDVLLADGFPQARRREHARQRRIQGFAIGLGLLGALFSVLGLLANVRQRGRELDAHLARQVDASTAARLLPPRRWAPILAISLIILGFLVVALATSFRLH